jgi:plastocyanin
MDGKDRVPRGVCTGMRGLSVLPTLAFGLALAAPAAALEQAITFPNGGPGSYSYSPANPSIKTGDKVTFNGPFVNHPLVWDSGTPSGSTAMGTSATFDHFKQPGTYAFHCAIHFGPPNNMVGSVTVVPDQHPASVSFSVSPSPRAGQPVTFTYTGSPDPDGTLTSWQWDLDGDGAFETTTPTGAASTTYASPATVTIRMRAIDDSNEPSATAEQAVTIAAADTSGSGGSGGSGSGSSGNQDTTAPRATLLKLKGLKLSFRSSERASATATLRARGKTIARGSAKAKSGTLSIRLRLTSAGRNMLPRGHKLRATLTLTLRDSSGNRRSVKRTLTVKRP